jgi:hypothetical protein
MAAFCEKCGAKLEGDSQFSHKCEVNAGMQGSGTASAPERNKPAQSPKYVIGLLVLVLVILIAAFAIQREQQKSLNGAPSDTAGSYHESDEVLYPYDLSKNPYQWKGHSGILDTLHVPMVMENGTRMGQVSYPGGCLKFSKMLDEHTAIYDVLVGNQSVLPEGVLAVIVPNSEPPNSARPWRVLVEGPIDAVNGLGQTITLTSIRFESYYTPSPQQEAQARQQQQAIQQAEQQRQAVQAEQQQQAVQAEQQRQAVKAEQQRQAEQQSALQQKIGQLEMQIGMTQQSADLYTSAAASTEYPSQKQRVLQKAAAERQQVQQLQIQLKQLQQQLRQLQQQAQPTADGIK